MPRMEERVLSKHKPARKSRSSGVLTGCVGKNSLTISSLNCKVLRPKGIEATATDAWAELNRWCPNWGGRIHWETF